MAVNAIAVSSVLGSPVDTDLELTSLIKAGLSLDSRDGLLRLGLSPAEIARHVIPARSWTHRSVQRRKGLPSVFSTEESGRILRTARLILRATELFGDRENALAWLRTPKERFEGQTPLALAETEHGAMLVEEMMVGAEQGFAA